VAVKVGATLAGYRCRLARPLATAAGTFTERQGVVLTLTTDDGVGRGEASPLPGFSSESVTEASVALRRWISADGPATGQPPQGPPSARCAADQALCALRAARQGCELGEVLGATGPAQVAVNALVADVAQAREAVARGHDTLKLKVGRGPWRDDVRRVEAVREVVGPQVRLRLDANRGWSPAEARAALEALAGVGLELVEEPCPGGADALAALRRVVAVPLAADESVRSEADLQALIDADAVSAVVLKPMLVGGLRRTVAMLQAAAAAGLDTVVTTTLGAGVARQGALAVAAAGPASLACGLGTGRWLVGDPYAGPHIAAGVARAAR